MIILDINYKTVFRIIKIFNNTGRIKAKGQGSDNKSKLNPEQKQIFLSWVNEYCLLRHKDIAKKIEEKFEINPLMPVCRYFYIPQKPL